MEKKNTISGLTKTTCLIGNPTQHSLSPALHNFSYQYVGLDAVYLCFDVEENGLEQVINGFKNMHGFVGCNVTMPLKRSIIPYLDEITAAAELTNAVNVVQFIDGKAIGHNSDGIGFMTNLHAHGINTENEEITLLGLGGAGSAILASAALDGVRRINLFTRGQGKSHKQAVEMAPLIIEKTDCQITLNELEDEEKLQESINNSSILINATNVGMGKTSELSPIDTKLLRSGIVVADVIYFPKQTLLLKEAKSLGNTAINGLGMLLHQAAISEKIWFDIDMPVKEVEKEFFSDEK